ncbi:carboxyl transferase domain-containing protein [Flammeovirgaceae bacterium SG7u.111]|nr:carboxyl transferase domain-containing protein [Flammeovirgaceae bacterium SG7u.132]WPO38342.1 carboxyl transferase domain-containing protein [Flammeovirgaceae bacterium SG7u.111]
MAILTTKIDTDSEQFTRNADLYENVLEEYRSRLKSVKDRSEEASVKRFVEKGRWTARLRVEYLVDDGSFLELSALAAWDIKKNQFPSAGLVTGIGKINGIDTVIIANDATVKGGTYIAEGIKKHLRALEIALQNKLPCVYLVDSGGVFLPDQADVFADRNHFGRFFYYQSRLSAKKIPQVAVVMGSCTAGGAYVPAMSDEVIMVKNQATVFIGGPPLVKAATGEEVSAEQLGGAEMHTAVSGVADHLAQNDEDALRICQDIFRHIRQKKVKNRLAEYQEPLYDIQELHGLIPDDLRRSYNLKEIIARIVDGSDFQEFKARYGRTLITGFAHIKGISVGIIANNGILFSESALKGAHFVTLCASRKIPIIFLQNIMGFMVGKRYEQGGLAKDGAKMIHAVANAKVPKITLVVGGSFGAGNYAMSGRGYDPNFLFLWPNAKTSVMGGQQAANVLLTIKKEQAQKAGKEVDEEELETLKQKILDKYEQEGSAYFSTARIWDDGIIEPKETRNVIARALEACLHKKIKESKFGVFRM